MAVKTPAPQRAAGRRSLAKRNLALPDGSFPVPNADYWDKARQAIGRVKDPAKRAAVARLLRRTAPRFGKAAELKNSWAAPGGQSHANDQLAIELVGPKGYDHGWRYVGGPGLPKTPGGRGVRAGAHRPRLPKSTLGGYKTTRAGRLKMGDRIAYGSKGSLEEHKVIAVSHHRTATGQVRTRIHLQRPDGSTHYTNVGANSPVQRRMTGSTFVHTRGSRGPLLQSSNDQPALEFAMTTMPIRDPSDLVIVRGEGGHSAIIRHRAGGDEIGQIRREGRTWRASVGGKDLSPRTHQRSALADVIGTHNRSALTPQHRSASAAGEPLQPAPQQTDLMRTYGIPAVRALATPTTGTSDGPRMTGQDTDNDNDSGSNGLSAKGQQIYRKLKAKGFPDARALAFAKRAQNFGGPK